MDYQLYMYFYLMISSATDLRVLSRDLQGDRQRFPRVRRDYSDYDEVNSWITEVMHAVEELNPDDIREMLRVIGDYLSIHKWLEFDRRKDSGFTGHGYVSNMHNPHFLTQSTFCKCMGYRYDCAVLKLQSQFDIWLCCLDLCMWLPFTTLILFKVSFPNENKWLQRRKGDPYMLLEHWDNLEWHYDPQHCGSESDESWSLHIYFMIRTFQFFSGLSRGISQPASGDTISRIGGQLP